MQDQQYQPVLRAAQLAEWKKEQGLLPRSFSPQSVLLCYQQSALQFACRGNHARRITGLAGETFLLEGDGRSIAVVRSPGPGGPAAVALMEELVALGARRLISIGLAGTLQPELTAGDLVIPERAIRDEGTSLHYLPKEKWAGANLDLTSALYAAVARDGRRIRLGSTWTTDAPYRETRKQVEEHRREGVDTVEMEVAALFAVGQSLGVQVAAGLSVADALDGVRAPLAFNWAAAERGLHILATAALRVLEGAE